MSIQFTISKTANDLPDKWDDLCTDYFQKKEFLNHAERYNPCGQRYYYCSEHERVRSAAVVYTLNLDLLTFLRIRSPMKMHIIGIPCSVSCSGLIGEQSFANQLADHIYNNEKGLILSLNLSSLNSRKMARGPTLPAVILSRSFQNFDAYQNSLRAHYRRRMKKILNQSAKLKIETTSCQTYNQEMHDLYLEVFKRSSGKLEKLSLDFFRNLPRNFVLRTFKAEHQLAGWSISLFAHGCQYFFMGGLDYQLNEKNATYFRILLEIVKEGIDNQAIVIDFGQTAEIPKMRLGGELSPRFIEAKHTFRPVNGMLRMSQKLLGYNKDFSNTHVFNS